MMRSKGQILVVLLVVLAILIVLVGRRAVSFKGNNQVNASQAQGNIADLNECERAIFAAGCFWHVQFEFDKVSGVVATTVGYTGGTTENPTYKQGCTHKTGHAEAVEIYYDPNRVSYEKLLDVFFENHNPTTKNRQGFDIGTQYRSAIFYCNPEQNKAALTKIDELSNSGEFFRPIVTEVKPAGPFYRAEEYHQKYFEKSSIFSCPIF